MTREAIFSAVREAAPDAFAVPAHIALLDAFLDLVGVSAVDAPETPPVAPYGARKVSSAGINLIKQFEGCRLTAYPDPGTGGEPWTIGYGATLIDGKPVRRGKTITQAEADALLTEDIERHADPVRALLAGMRTTQNQFDALVSFAFNVGVGALKGSTLLRKHMAGDYAGAAAEFARWNKANGRVLAGLTRRRAAEAALYRS